MQLFQRDLLTTQDWAPEEIGLLLDIAEKMRRERHAPEHREILAGRTFFMLFFSSSLRTRLSFVTAASELGGGGRQSRFSRRQPVSGRRVTGTRRSRT